MTRIEDQLILDAQKDVARLTCELGECRRVNRDLLNQITDLTEMCMHGTAKDDDLAWVNGLRQRVAYNMPPLTMDEVKRLYRLAGGTVMDIPT